MIDPRILLTEWYLDSFVLHIQLVVVCVILTSTLSVMSLVLFLVYNHLASLHTVNV